MNYVEILVVKYRNRGILVDSNLVCLLFAGMLDEASIPNVKPTKAYSVNDYLLLKQVLAPFRNRMIRTTPNILTEVSNILGNAYHGDRRAEFRKALKIAARQLFAESYFDSESVRRRAEHEKFGLTDSAIIAACQADERYRLLSDDLNLVQYAGGQQVDAINFNHVRLNVAH